MLKNYNDVNGTTKKNTCVYVYIYIYIYIYMLSVIGMYI